MKKRTGICAALLCSFCLLSGCSELLKAPIGVWAESESEASAEAGEDIERFAVTNLDLRTQSDFWVEIDLEELKEGTAVASGSVEETYRYEDGSLTILAAGDYLLSGDFDGEIVVAVFPDEVVSLFLNGVRVEAKDGPALYVRQAAKVILTAMEGTDNVFSDALGSARDHKACIYSAADLTINGGGRLSVYGLWGDAVRTRDLLKAIGTTLFVSTKKDGLRGNDGVILLNCAADIESEGTGICADSADDLVMVQGGSLKVIAGEHAVTAVNHVSIHECEADLYAVLETVKCSGVRDMEEGIAE